MTHALLHRSALVVSAVTLLVIVSAVAIYEFGPFRSSSSATGQSKMLKVLATFYPIYDFTKNVGGDKISLTLLVPETVDVHNFDPTPSSVLQVSSADLLIYNGAGLEPWIPQIVSAADNPRLVVVDTSQGIPLLQVPPQFQKENRTVDPHIWLDPVLAKQQVDNILKGLIKADPLDQLYFTANAQNYEAKLDYLNSQIVNGTANVKTRDFVTFHEAFAYFAKQYNLTQIPIAGPFEEEPTTSDIQNVIDAIHQHHLLYVGYESLENPAISQAISSETNATLILMNPIEGLTAQEQSAGKTYLSLMQEDLSNIVLALNNVGIS
ncbi:MAG: zinc ABC transporter substrate-binding protein [Candidatus Bathyarchaeia archaeon]